MADGAGVSSREDAHLPFAGRKVAIVHDWLTGMRGGEWCLDLFCELLPHATVFTLVHLPGRLSRRIESMDIRTSFIDKLPGSHRSHQKFLPLFPAAVERFDLSGYEFVLSTSHCVAKGAIAPEGARHVCYCYTPMRYVWKFFDQYFANERTGLATRLVMPPVASYLRGWDRRSASRVDRFIAISDYIAERIEDVYGRSSEVIVPPVDLSRFRCDRVREEFYLVVSALVPYKNVEVAVRAFTKLGDPLVIVGKGPEEQHLRRIAGPNVTFTGWASDEHVADYLSRARALLFPGEEDFGIVPLEAQASGCPVLALGAGGALETIIDGETGFFFDEATEEQIIEAVRRFELSRFDPEVLRRNAERFDLALFRERIRALLIDEERRLR